jgi:hypothetical protein
MNDECEHGFWPETCTACWISRAEKAEARVAELEAQVAACARAGCPTSAETVGIDYLAMRCPKCLARNGDHIIGLDIEVPQCPPSVPSLAAPSVSNAPGWVTAACTKGGHDLCLNLECLCECHKRERSSEASPRCTNCGEDENQVWPNTACSGVGPTASHNFVPLSEPPWTNEAEREIGRLVASKTSEGRPMHPRTDKALPPSGPLDALQIITVDRDIWKQRAENAQAALKHAERAIQAQRAETALPSVLAGNDALYERGLIVAWLRDICGTTKYERIYARLADKIDAGAHVPDEPSVTGGTGT